MSDSAAQPTSRSTFPPPPPWWRLYPPDPPPQFSTTAARNDTTDAAQPPLPTAFGLSIFDPPAPPASPTTPYVLFNQAYTLSPPPPPLPPNTPQLFTSEPDGRIQYAKQLSQLAASLQTHWLALLQTLSTARPNTAQLLAALSHCYLNITHLLARLRRHQAVQHVLLLSREQLKKRRQRRERLEAEVANCKALLARHGMEWADEDRSVELRRQALEEAKDRGGKGMKEEKEVADEELEVGKRVKEEAQDVKGEADVEGDDGEDEDAAADLQRAVQLEALLDSIDDTYD